MNDHEGSVAAPATDEAAISDLVTKDVEAHVERVRPLGDLLFDVARDVYGAEREPRARAVISRLIAGEVSLAYQRGLLDGRGAGRP